MFAWGGWPQPFGFPLDLFIAEVSGSGNPSVGRADRILMGLTSVLCHQHLSFKLSDSWVSVRLESFAFSPLQGSFPTLN